MTDINITTTITTTIIIAIKRVKQIVIDSLFAAGTEAFVNIITTIARLDYHNFL